MAKRSSIVSAAAFAATLAALLGRATTTHSVNGLPLIYRAVSNVNDLDSVEGMAPPGSTVELWARQRNFKEGVVDSPTDPFAWCAWKNNGNPVWVGTTVTGGNGVWRLSGLRNTGNTIMLFPAGPGGDRCLGGLYTELLPRVCDFSGCSTWSAPTLHWLNVRKLSDVVAGVAGSESGGEQAAAAVADGPDDGPEPTDVVDVDQNGVDTNSPGFTVGQRITWKCGTGGTFPCPSTTVHDSSTAITPDPEYPFVLGTIQAHRHGGSFIAAAAIPRGTPLGFAVDVNVRFRGLLDVNLGCDRKRFFDFSLPLVN